MLVDSHCHLDFDVLAEDIDGVLARARENGVSHMVTISTRIRRFERLLAIAEAHDNVFCSIGTHPHNAHEELDISIDEIIALSQHPKCVAIGEAGLDYYYDSSPREAQAQGFRSHIAASRRTGLPLVIHARSADDDMISILEEETEQGAFPFVLHCFSSGAELARRGLELGGYVSFSGIVTFKNAREIQEVAKFVPADRFLVETDAPYLAPVPHRGKSNEPGFVRHTAEKLAELRGTSFETIAEQSTANFKRLFSKAKLDR
ncbi:TatD family hydrolase [Pelagibacterium sp. 26DY04]|uniref:TatD family hydrolase n=1 Tax=Pelagibacterium sp. 26DY04 TaxID=2967130 RepID=UPI002815AADF|nr:TatD family hydrolase [Pelagibacterium sp. 26DY04]WMT85193.1 TatD family hydrolase [Pelagibacterium sp. 26DY04]